ncbi:citrate:proton symporter [Lentibacillus sp. N15]|uniref:CitMHS family transporter n=1 Tax=Lentibacillus songyuanensis TaxID=3136161 RepID=UPI0031BB0866
MLVLLGFLIILGLIYFVFLGKSSPVVAFIILPLIAVLILGFSGGEIADFIMTGIDQTWQIAVLFIFSITYFGIMNDAGLFDKVINKLLYFSQNRVTAIYISTVLIAMVAHLDGSGATTFIITIPALLPIYLKLGLKPTTLILLVASAAGAMNFVPWGGSTTRTASIIGINPTELWIELLPVQVFAMLLAIGLAIILPKIEKVDLKNTQGEGFKVSTLEFTEEQLKLKRYKLLPFNAILTIALVIMMFAFKDLPLFVIFMIGVAIALPLNYRTLKEQHARIEAHASSAILMATIILSAGVFLGVMSESGMITEMANAVVGILPDFMGQFVHILVALFAAPIHLVVGTDPYYYGLMPVIENVAQTFGISSKSVGIAMIIGEAPTWVVSAVAPAVYLAIGLAGVEYKEHLKYSFKYTWAMSILMVAFAIVIGLIPLK